MKLQHKLERRGTWLKQRDAELEKVKSELLAEKAERIRLEAQVASLQHAVKEFDTVLSMMPAHLQEAIDMFGEPVPFKAKPKLEKFLGDQVMNHVAIRDALSDMDERSALLETSQGAQQQQVMGWFEAAPHKQEHGPPREEQQADPGIRKVVTRARTVALGGAPGTPQMKRSPSASSQRSQSATSDASSRRTASEPATNSRKGVKIRIGGSMRPDAAPDASATAGFL